MAIAFAGYRRKQATAGQHSEERLLRVLRRVLRIACEWGAGTVPRIKMLPGERHRERVVSF